MKNSRCPKAKLPVTYLEPLQDAIKVAQKKLKSKELEEGD